MKKLFSYVILLSMIFLGTNVLADDIDLPSTGDLWDNWDSSQDNYKESKSVSDEDFDKAINKIKEKTNKREAKLKKKQIPKGEEFHQSNESEVIKNEISDDSLPVVSIPIGLLIDNEILPIGHYQIKGEKDENGNPVLKFYQAHYLMAQVPAIETNDDFDEESITFAKWVSEDDNHIKIIFGTMDINVYAIIQIQEDENLANF
jgi:hypothetical protein